MNINDLYENLNQIISTQDAKNIKLDSDIKLRTTYFQDSFRLTFDINGNSFMDMKRIKLEFKTDLESNILLKLDFLLIEKDSEAGIDTEEEFGYSYYIRYKGDGSANLIKKTQVNAFMYSDYLKEIDKPEEKIMFIMENFLIDRLELEDLYNLKYDSYIYQDKTFDKLIRVLEYTKNIDMEITNNLKIKNN